VHPNIGKIPGIGSNAGFDFNVDTKAAVDRLLRAGENEGVNYNNEGHDACWRKTLVDANAVGGGVPGYMNVISVLVRRAVHVCVPLCIEFFNDKWEELWTMIGKELAGDVTYNPAQSGGHLGGNIGICTSILGVAMEFGEALTWQEAVIGLGGHEDPAAKCGWDAGLSGGLNYGNINQLKNVAGLVIAKFDDKPVHTTGYKWSFHSHWHWAAADVIANFYAVAKSVQDSYFTCDAPLGWYRSGWNPIYQQRQRCCYPRSSSQC
jgi:hypothetical protein